MRTRSSTLVVLAVGAVFSLVACGDDGGGDSTDSTDSTDGMIDAPVATTGFEKPLERIKANVDKMEVGEADLSCLGTATDAMPTTGDIALTAKVIDFQRRTPVVGAMVTAFAGINYMTPFDPATTADADGNVTVTIDAGTRLFGFKMTSSTSLDTLLLNQKLDDGTTGTQTYEDIRIVSKITADTLPAIIGIDEGRTPGTGVLAGTLRDCQAREISNFIATVSTTSGTPNRPDGVLTYYFNTAPTPLPSKHSQNPDASASGLFLVLDIPPATTGYVQMYGYLTDADVMNDNLTLLAELAVPVIADTVVTGSYRPLRTGE